MAYKIKPFCLGCHYCALECPTHAIDYKGTQYQIDPEKCVECGKCVEVCNISAIDTGKPGDGHSPIPRLKKQRMWSSSVRSANLHRSSWRH